MSVMQDVVRRVRRVWEAVANAVMEHVREAWDARLVGGGTSSAEEPTPSAADVGHAPRESGRFPTRASAARRSQAASPSFWTRPTHGDGGGIVFTIGGGRPLVERHLRRVLSKLQIGVPHGFRSNLRDWQPR